MILRSYSNPNNGAKVLPSSDTLNPGLKLTLFSPANVVTDTAMITPRIAFDNNCFIHSPFIIFLSLYHTFSKLNIDLCIFCSGTYDPKLEKEINKDQIKKTMDVNFFGVVNCIKSVETYFKKKKTGHISIVSSIAGYRGLPNSSGYGPSKAALTNLTESLYFDFKKYNVRISLISPGFIKTPLTDKNEFRMPFIRSPQFAANKIFNGLTKSKSFEITFPKQLTIIFKFFRILPYRIYLFLVNKLVKR